MIELEHSDERYRLVFEGPEDESEETLRRIKGTFLADLEVPADQIVSILQGTPSTVQQADKPEKLERAYELLRRAGSRVLIVNSSGIPWKIPEKPEPGDTIMFEFGDSDEPVEVSRETVAPKLDQHAFEVEEDLDASLESLLEQAAAVLPDDSSAQQLEPVDSGHTFSLELDTSDSIPVMEAPEPPIEELLRIDHLESGKPLPEVAAKVEEEPFSLSLADEEKPAAPAPEPTAAAPAPAPEPSMQLSLSVDEAPSTPAPEVKEEAQAKPPPIVEAPKLETSPPVKPAEPAPVKKQEPISPLVTKPIVPSEPQGPPPDISLVTVRDKRGKKLPPAVELGSWIAIGSVLLFMANWFYFNRPPPADEADLVMAQELALKVAQKKKLIQKKQVQQMEMEQKQAELMKPKPYQGETTVDGYRLLVTLSSTTTTPTEAAVVIESPPQHDPTKEEIARGILPPPWIRRIETGPFEFKLGEDGTFRGEATAKVFVEHRGTPSRLVRSVVLTGQVDAQAESISVTLTVPEEGGAPSADTHWELSGDAASIHFSLSQPLQVKPVAEIAAAEPAAADVIPAVPVSKE